MQTRFLVKISCEYIPNFTDVWQTNHIIGSKQESYKKVVICIIYADLMRNENL